jgi:hypothetical protein
MGLIGFVHKEASPALSSVPRARAFFQTVARARLCIFA